jgi:hypothetical protein
MRGKIRRLARFVAPLAGALLLGASATTLVAGASPAGASGATPNCPNVEVGQGCAYIITVNSNDSATIAPGADPAPFDGQDDIVVGVANNSSGMLESVSITEGNENDDIFGFDGDGICTVSFVGDGYCDSQQKEGVNPYDYEGPDNTFSVSNPYQGTINFDTALAPGGTTFLSLETAPSITDTTLSAVVLTGSPVNITPKTTNKQFTAEVATFTYTNTSAPSGDFSADISWGDGTTSTGTVNGSDGSFTVDGTHTYTQHGTTAGPVTVTITDLTETSVTVTDNHVMVADSVTDCMGASCTGTLDKGNVNADLTTTNSGYLLVSSDPNGGSTGLDCGDGFRHAPSITTETNTFDELTKTIIATITFPISAGTPGYGIASYFFWICFSSNVPFKTVTGQWTTLGLLPRCLQYPGYTGPCMFLPTFSGGNVTETALFSPDDPRWG